jgi:hypothetical protein
LVIEITPAQAHMHLLVLSSAGLLSSITVVAPGAHGPVGAGTHGAGVNTPAAADVAEITAGFVGAEHIPKGGMFVFGTMSGIVAAGCPSIVTVAGVTVSTAGAAPNEHWSWAVFTTWFGICASGTLDQPSDHL